MNRITAKRQALLPIRPQQPTRRTTADRGAAWPSPPERESDMPINSGLASVSNALIVATVVFYAIAMLSYACDFAFAKRRVLATAAAPQAAVPQLVAAGAGGPTVSVNAPTDSAGSTGARASRWPSGFWLRLAFGLTCIGLF